MSYNSYGSYYESLQFLKSELNYGIQEIENLFPYERDYYVMITNNKLKEKQNEQEQL